LAPPKKLCQINKQKTEKEQRCSKEKASLSIGQKNEESEKMQDARQNPIMKKNKGMNNEIVTIY